jgi:riboflavin synthase
MYTGIIKHIGEVSAIKKVTGLYSFTFKCPKGFLANVELGASIAINGVCLTVTHFNENEFSADAMQETLRCTTLGSLESGNKVHLERSAKSGIEVGGHILSGHVDGRAKVIEIKTPVNNYVITFEVDSKLKPYIFEKGYIAINGTS